MSVNNIDTNITGDSCINADYSSKKKKVRPHPDGDDNLSTHLTSKKKKVEHIVTNSISKSKIKLIFR